MALGAAQLDFSPAPTWNHRSGDSTDGFRVVKSLDHPGSVILQIQHGGEVLSLRMDDAVLAQIHRQAVAGDGEQG